jgi:hypothetical protein
MKAFQFLCWLIFFLLVFAGFFNLFTNGPQQFVEGAKTNFLLAKKSLGFDDSTAQTPKSLGLDDPAAQAPAPSAPIAPAEGGTSIPSETPVVAPPPENSTPTTPAPPPENKAP